MDDYFHNPYQFIAINTNKAKGNTSFKDIEDLKQTAQWARHDFWAKEGFSGKISCTLKTMSPVVVGGLQTPSSKEEKREGVVHNYLNRNGNLAIPANSLRGMVSSIAEVISQSSMRVLDTMEGDFYSTRMSTEEAFKELGLLCQRDEEWFIYPLGKGESDGNYNDEYDSLFLRSHECYQHEQNPERHKYGVFYIRGEHDSMPKKLHETYIEWDGEIVEKDLLPVDGSIVTTLEKMLRERYEDECDFPYLPKGYEKDSRRSWSDSNKPLVLSGDLIYYKSTFSLQEKKMEVTALSYSAIGRRPVTGHLTAAFERHSGKNSLPWNKNRTELTPVEALFGVVEEQAKNETKNEARNLASRVSFTDAELTEGSKNKRLLPQQCLKILGSPKPPSPTMYFSKKNGGYISKADLDLTVHHPNGRKRYLPHPNTLGKQDVAYHFGTQLTGKDYRPHLHLKCTPIDVETEFQFDIYFENLSKAELELLHKSLLPCDGFLHRLGLGKPLGLGHVTITQALPYVIDRQQYYSVTSLLGDKKERYQPCEVMPCEETDTLIDQMALETLLMLSDPNNIKYPVCYPYSEKEGQKAHSETEGFKWFVCNDRAAASKDNDYKGQFLQSLNSEQSESGMSIPFLDADIDCPTKPQGSQKQSKNNRKASKFNYRR